MANKTVTVRPSGGDYTSLSAAITGEESANADLTAAGMNGILTISIEGTWSADDTSTVFARYFVADSTHYLKIIDNSGGTYRLNTSSGRTLDIRCDYSKIIGVRLHSAATTEPVVLLTGTGLALDGLDISGGRDGIWLINNGNNPYYIVNCVLYGHTRYGIFGNQDPLTAYIYNTTCYGGTYGIYADYAET